MSQPQFIWDVQVFADFYNTIRFESRVPENLSDEIGNDLKTILNLPSRNEKSRSALAAGETGKPVQFHSGAEYKLNKPFIADASHVATELSLDELASAELLQLATASASSKGAELTDSGRLAYFQRLDYILNIVGYLAGEKRLLLLYAENEPPQKLLQAILASFKKIYELLKIQNDLIDKQKVTADINDLLFVTRVKFMKNKLYDTHTVLSQVLYTLVDAHMDKLASWETFSLVSGHVSECISDDADLLLLHYLPTLLRLVSTPAELPELQVVKFHENFSKQLAADHAKVSDLAGNIDMLNLSIRQYLLVVQLVFFIAFVPWCKEQEARTKKFAFNADILKYIEWLVSYGTLEQVLSYTAESAKPESRALYEQNNLYNFRPLLQRTQPLLRPSKFIYSGTDELLHLVKARPELTNVAALCDYQTFAVTSEFSDSLLAPFFHKFITNFISHAAIVLTLLRDSEEDFLLLASNRRQLESEQTRKSSVSGGDFDSFVLSRDLSAYKADQARDQGLNLDEIATRADLERFYMSCVYTYSYRPELCLEFWEVDDSNVIGFISWGISNNTSPLITATFCLLLGSLTFGGETSSARVWDILVNSQSGTVKRNDYSKISVDSILNSLTYYIDALTDNLDQDLSEHTRSQQKKQEFLFSGNTSKSEPAQSPLSIQLSEDSVVFISGFLMLISLIVQNADGDSDTSRNLRQVAFARFQNIVTSFLKFDNLIISAKSLRSDLKSSPVNFNDQNRTIIINLVLNLLSAFASNSQSLDLRYKIWVIVDRWLCYNINENDTSASAPSETTRYAGVSLSSTLATSTKSEHTKLKLLHRGISLKQSFQITLTNLSEVINFTQLMQKLLTPVGESLAAQLLYPANLGEGYRHNNQIGIWPYIEFLIVEVLGHSKGLKTDATKHLLQAVLLDIIKSSFVDWMFLSDTAPALLVDLSKQEGFFASSELVTGEPVNLTYETFVRLHHSPAILNYLFDDRANSVIFEIIDIGTEAIDSNETLTSLVDVALNVFHQVLDVQEVFITKVLPVLKNANTVPSAKSGPMGYGTTLSLVMATPKSTFDNIYYPTSLGTKGVSDFYEILLFHIPSLVHFALYVGYPNDSIAMSAIKILSLISQNTLFALQGYGGGSLLLQRNRLLSIFESIDESLRIQHAFVLQIEDVSDWLQIKYNILSYLISTLPSTQEVTVAHFLLGFSVRGGRLELAESDEDQVSLLLSLVELLISTLDMISEVDYSKGFKHNVAIGPARITLMILEIVNLLCQNPISSSITLAFLRKYDLFSRLLTVQPKIDDMTIWEEFKFDGDLQEPNNKFVLSESSCKTFFSFLNYRNSVLQYLSLELHDIKSATKKEFYVNLLLENTEYLNGTPKVLNFLDVLNFQFYNAEDYRFERFNKKYDLDNLLFEIKKQRDGEDTSSVLEKILSLKQRLAQVNIPLSDAKETAIAETQSELAVIEKLLTKFLVADELKTIHLKSLHSWVQIIQVLTSDGVIDKSDFILRVLQMILPKINNEYYERDIQFAEELMSLCVLLFDLYDETESANDTAEHKLHRLFPLFKTCVNGVLSQNSTPSLRADLYLLLNKFLHRSIKAESVLHEILSVLRSIDKRFIDIVCNDLIYSEGVPRVTSIIFMESLIHLSTVEKSTAILDVLIRNNSLSLLVRSLKRTDEIIVACDNSDGKVPSGINVETLLYELTTLKATLYLLVRIAQTKLGASQLIQNEIFPIIRQLKFLSIDADLGLDLQIDTMKDGHNKFAQINLSLDVPLVLHDKATNSEPLTLVSYYEFLVPTFQLVATILLSMGPAYTPGTEQAEELLKHYHLFMVAIMKRDALIENEKLGVDDNAVSGLRQLVKLLTLIDSLVKSRDA